MNDEIVSAQPRPRSATYTLAEAASLFGIAYGTLWLQVQEGRAPVQPIRVGRSWRFTRSSVDRLLGIDSQSGDGRAA